LLKKTNNRIACDFFLNPIILFFGLVINLYSCKITEKYPICYQLSKDNPCGIKDYEGINKVTYNSCIKRHIKITPLSNVVAEFRGSKSKMEWLKKNYYLLVCDFNPDNHGAVTNEKYCSLCLQFSRDWISVVQGRRIDTIAAHHLQYLNICIDKN